MTDAIDNPPEWTFFDEQGRRIAVTQPVYDPPDDDDAQANDRADFQTKLGLFLAWLARGGSVQSAGRKAMFLAYAAGKTQFRTDAELARALNMSPSRFSHFRTEMREFFPALANCNRRQAQPRPIGE